MADTKTKTKTDVYSTLLDDLAAGAFLPGQRLGEETLAGRYSVSRMPVRDALIRLESEGLVERIPQSGTYVREMTSEDIEELFGLRAAIERFVIRKAARVATKEQLDQLEKLAREADDSLVGESTEVILEREVRFHMGLCEIANLRHAGRMLEVLRLFTRSFRLILKATGGGGPSREHQEIVEALRSRDADWCEVLIRRHIETVPERLAARAQREAEGQS